MQKCMKHFFVGKGERGFIRKNIISAVQNMLKIVNRSLPGFFLPGESGTKWTAVASIASGVTWLTNKFHRELHYELFVRCGENVVCIGDKRAPQQPFAIFWLHFFFD